MVKHPNTRVTIAKVGNINVANCNKCILKNINSVAAKQMIKLLKMAKIEDNIRTQIKDDVDLVMMPLIIGLTG